MFNEKIVVAFMPIRAGSKAIQNKNIKSFCDKPLYEIQLSILLQVDEIDHIVISTDIPELLTGIIYDPDKIEIFNRDPKTALDEATTELAMEDYIKRKKLTDEIFILVQATNPFTRKENYIKAIKMLDYYDSILSAVKSNKFYWINGQSLNYDYKERKRRQDFNTCLYVENGAFYISTANKILKYNNRLYGNIGLVEMPEYSMFELDTEEDWKLCEILYRNYFL